MRVKLTPLNFVSALSLCAVFAILLDQRWILSVANQEYKYLLIAFAVLTLFASFLIDQIFRKLFANLVRIWIVQISLIFLTIALVFIFKGVFIN